MKPHFRGKILLFLAVLCLTLAAIPAAADSVLFGNYPIDGTTDAYTINNGYEATDGFYILSITGYTIDEFKFGAWLYPGDKVTSVTWSLDSLPFGVDGKTAKNTNYGLGAGCSDCGTVTTKYISTNEYGYEINEVTVSGLNGGKGVAVPANGYGIWLTLKDAIAVGSSKLTNDPVFWDVKSCSTWWYFCPFAYYIGPPALSPVAPNSLQIIGH